MYQLLNLINRAQLRLMDARDNVTNKDKGATATEYAMLVAFIAIAIVAAVTLFGDHLAKFFHDLGDKVGLTNDTSAGAGS